MFRTALLVVVDEAVERALLLSADVRHQQPDRVPVGRGPLYAAQIVADDLREVETTNVAPGGARPHDRVRRLRGREHDEGGRLPAAIERQVLWHALDAEVLVEGAQAARERAA